MTETETGAPSAPSPPVAAPAPSGPSPSLSVSPAGQPGEPAKGYHASADQKPSDLSEQTSGYYAIAIALVLGLAIILSTLWVAGDGFNKALESAKLNYAASSGANAGAAGANAPSPTPPAAPPSAQPSAALPAIDLSKRPYQGAADAPVTVFEIADFQCPYCVQAHPTVKQVMAKYNDSVRLVFVHFPLTSIHPLAQKAAEASECANDQGKFLEYYDKLFSDNKLEVADLKAAAATLGLDTAKFNACLDSGEKAPLVAAFVKLATDSGIDSTPTFIVNGVVLEDRSFAGFEKAIQAVLNPPRAQISTAGRPTWGNASAPVSIIEFSDFECPYCEAAYATVKEVERNYAGQVSITFMHFPLNSIHPLAQKAAEGAECAYRQKPEAFWQFHDWMFENRSLDVASLKAYAGAIGLNTTKFNACLDGGEAAAQVGSDQDAGLANGISGTPGFFINGLPLKGYLPYAQFKPYIDRELALLAKNATNASATNTSG